MKQRTYFIPFSVLLTAVILAGFSTGCEDEKNVQEIARLNAQVQKLEGEVEDLEKDLDKAKDKTKRLEANLKDAQKELVRTSRQAKRDIAKADKSAQREQKELAQKHAEELNQTKQRYERMVSSLNDEIIRVQKQLKEAKSALASQQQPPVQNPGQNQAEDDLDPRKLAKLVKAYNHYWSKAAETIRAARADSEIILDKQTRDMVVVNYTHCLAQINKIEKLTEGMTLTNGPTWNSLQSIYTSLCDHRWGHYPWRLCTYKRAYPNKNVPYNTSVSALVEKIKKELLEQQKQIASIEVHRQKRVTKKSW